MEFFAAVDFTPQRVSLILMLVAFIGTFLITRGITRKIRSERLAEDGAPPDDVADAKGGRKVIQDIEIGGVHIHHQVWGLLLMLVSGMVQFAFEPISPWLQITAVMFGVGAALVLDEFALWLHLDDVYWSAAGQKSVDAVVATACVMTLLLLGYGPFGLATTEIDDAPIVIPVAIAINMTLVVITVMKGKIMMAAIGFFFPLLALIGAVRLARVPSWWSRKRYASRPKKMDRATAREETTRRRINRMRMTLGGTPDPS